MSATGIPIDNDRASGSSARSPVEERVGRTGGLSQRQTLAVAAITLLALALRLTSLSRSLFNDETVSLALAQRSFGHMLSLFGYEANGTSYELVLWPFIRIFGDGELALRLPAVVAGTASVPALYWAARGFVREHRVALLAAGLLAINPMAIWYSQTARSYAFVVLAACLAFGALVRALQAPGRRGAWAGYVGGTVLLAYSNLLAAPIVLPAQLLLVWRGGRPGMRRWLAALGAVFIACIPPLVASVISHGRRNALYWLPKLSRGLVELALQEFSGGFSEVTAVRWLTLLGGVVLVGAAIWSMRRAAATATGERSTFAVAVAWGVLPIVLLLVVSVKEPLFWPRYAIVALPGLCLLGALAAHRLMKARSGLLLAAGCLAVVTAAGLYADARQVNSLQQSWPPVAAWLRSARAPGQPTIVDNVLVLPSLGYYDAAFRAPDGDLAVEEWRDRTLPRGFIGFKDPSGYGGAPSGPPGVALFRRLARGDGGTVWMIFSEVDKDEQGDPAQMPIVNWARGHCHVEKRESVGVQVLRASSCRD